MLIRTQPTILLEILCEIMLNSKVISKSIIVPEDFSKSPGVDGLQPVYHQDAYTLHSWKRKK